MDSVLPLVDMHAFLLVLVLFVLSKSTYDLCDIYVYVCATGLLWYVSFHSGMASVGSFLETYRDLTEDEILHVWSTLYYGEN